MKRFGSKLAFVHRTLWQRGHAYRWAALLGPPPLIGCALAALFWAGEQRFSTRAPADPADSRAPWARWTRPVVATGQPFTETPSAALPPIDATGHPSGLQPGWVGSIRPITIDATLDVDVIAASLGSYTLDQPTIPLARIVDAGPPTGLFVGTASAFFAARRGGVYAFSARLARAGTQSATCLVRLGSAHHRILRNVILHAAGDAALDFAPTEFRLSPGLFILQVAVGCWRGDRMAGAGALTLMVRHPGDTALEPARADELMRPSPRQSTGAGPGASPAR